MVIILRVIELIKVINTIISDRAGYLRALPLFSTKQYEDLTKQYEVPLSRMLHDILDDDHIQWHHPLIGHYTNFLTITDLDLITEFEFLPNCTRFPYNICNGCGMPTDDAYPSGHLVLSHFWTCMCSNVEINLSWTCFVSGLLNFEHPSELLFCLELYEIPATIRKK